MGTNRPDEYEEEKEEGGGGGGDDDDDDGDDVNDNNDTEGCDIDIAIHVDNKTDTFFSQTESQGIWDTGANPSSTACTASTATEVGAIR